LRLKVERSPHPGQHLSIYGIGFGAGAIRLMIRPHRLEHDPCRCCRAQPFFQRSKSRRRILEALRFIIFQPEDIQMEF
jgi:hypothetical protein